MIYVNPSMLSNMNLYVPHVWEIGHTKAFTVNGSFIVPDTGLYTIILIGGGGGGGGGARINNYSGAYASGGGGGRSGKSVAQVRLTKDEVISVTIGQGGSNGTSQSARNTATGTSGASGTQSYFGSNSSPAGNNGGGGASAYTSQYDSSLILTKGSGGTGFGTLGVSGSDGTTGSSTTYGAGASGYIFNGEAEGYDGGAYGGGANGLTYSQSGGKGSNGIVFVTLNEYVR